MKINTSTTSVILLVGGSGSRFSSLNEQPKQLSKLNNDYILMHIIKNLNKHGLNHFILPLGYKINFFKKFFNSKKNIKKYKFNLLSKNFKNSNLKKNRINISLFNAGKNTNKMKRVIKSLKYIIDNDLLIVYGDDLSNIKIKEIFKKYIYFKKRKAIATVFKKRSQYGHVVINKNGFIKKFVEKPTFSNPINIGNYLINSSLIKKFKSNKEIESNFLPKLTKKGLLVSFEHKGYFYSINDKKELITAKKKLRNL